MADSQHLLITGATGLLGTALVPEAIRRDYRVTAFSQGGSAVAGQSSTALDLTQPDEARAKLDAVRPDIIIHGAAATDVDRCEAHPKWAQAVNVEATAVLAEWAARAGIPFVYISTDSVFDGRKGLYAEDDPPRPLNHYAKTKWLGEEEARRLAPRHLVLRTNFFGWSSGSKLSLAEWILRSFWRQEPINAFTDVRFSPLFTEHLAALILDLVAQGPTGTLHLGARDVCSKFAFAEAVRDTFACSAQITPVTVDAFPFHAFRPKDTSLKVEKASRLLNRPLPSVQEGLRAFRAAYDEGRVKRDMSQWHVSSI